MPLYNLFLGSLHYGNICFSNQSSNVLLEYMLLVTIIHYNQNSVCSFRFLPYWSPLKVILILYLYFPDAISMCLALVAYKTLYLDVLETLLLSNCVKKWFIILYPQFKPLSFHLSLFPLIVLVANNQIEIQLKLELIYHGQYHIVITFPLKHTTRWEAWNNMKRTLYPLCFTFSNRGGRHCFAKEVQREFCVPY